MEAGQGGEAARREALGVGWGVTGSKPPNQCAGKNLVGSTGLPSFLISKCKFT